MIKQSIREIYRDLNNTTTNFPSNTSIPVIFEEIVKNNCSREALIFKNTSINYEELNQKANKVGNYLHTIGMQIGFGAAILLDRDPNIYISMLGILKAGGVYIPLDTTLPTKRLEYIILNSDAQVLITSRKFYKDVSFERINTKVIYVEDIIENKAYSKKNLKLDIKPNDPAYIMYTSGTTGNPKGVKISHKGIIRLVKKTNYINIRKEDSILQYASIGFDASTFEIWGSFLNGARLGVFPSNVGTLDELTDYINKYSISIIWLTSGLFNIMVENNIEAFNGVSTVLTGGDIVSVTTVNKLLKNSNCTIINGYGPTENTTFTTYNRVNKQVMTTRLPIGKPISNTKVYVLDSNYKPVGINEVGELYIGGEGVAIGYHKFDNSSFVNMTVFDDVGEERIYKTGDLVKVLPDLQLDFIGRVDNQVKIRGYRVEPEEIKILLINTPEINDALVLVTGNDTTDKKLVAYIVADVPINTERLKKDLSQKFPEYMIPDIFIQLESFPLNHNGKIDKNELLKTTLINSKADIKVFSIDNWNDFQKKIYKIYSEILGHNSISLTENFFRIGGNSLLAMCVISRLNNKFNVKLGFQEFYKNSSIKKLESLILSKRNDVKESIFSLETERCFGASSYEQRSLWFLNQLDPNDSSYNIVKRYQIKEKVSYTRFQRAIDSLIKFNSILRTSFYNDGDILKQRIEEFKHRELEIIDLSALSYEKQQLEIDEFIKKEVELKYKLDEDQLCRFFLIKESESSFSFIINIHHIISDGQTIELIIDSLLHYYNLELNQEQDWKETNRYLEYAEYQKSRSDKIYLNKQLEYWVRRLDKQTKTIELPFTNTVEDNDSNYTGSFHTIKISHELYAKLLKLAQHENTTLFTLILSTFNVLLYRYTLEEEITIGTPVSTRDVNRGYHKTLGFFMNTLVLNNNLSGNPKFTELLKKISNTTLSAFENKDIPFEKVVRTLNPGRDNNQHSPLFNIMLNYHNYPKSKLLVEQENWKEIKIKYRNSRFNMSVNIYEIEGKLEIEFVYRKNRYDEMYIKKLAECFKELLNSITLNPETNIDSINLLPDIEKQKLLYQINQSSIDVPNDIFINDLFEEQVEIHKNKTAIVYANNRITYGELQVVSNQIANYLLEQGIESGENILIDMTKSPNTIALILAIWKIGCSYTYINNSMPKSLIQHLQKQTKAQFVVLSGDLNGEKYLDIGSIKLLYIEAAINKSLPNKFTVPSIRKELNNTLAYITFTSGTTGTPKGVQTSHKSVINYIYYLRNTYNITTKDTVLQIPSLSFDSSIRDIFGTLSLGGELILPSEEADGDPSKLIELINEYNITCILSVVPSFMTELVNAANYSKLIINSLRLILLSGEKLYTSLTKDIYKYINPNVTIVNQYGPTECTLTSTYFILNHSSDKIPVGIPIPNQRVYILDRYLHPVPVGGYGYIYISGIGLSQGYIGNEKLTEESFLDNPFEKGQKLYKTGDIGLYNSNYNLNYISRSDRQVKVRGVRVELDSIEIYINQLLNIEKAIVVLEGEPKRLVCYIKGEITHIDTVIDHLRKKISNNVMPTHFYKIDYIPLKKNGKIDYKALENSLNKKELNFYNSSIIEPINNLQLQLKKIWEDILNVDCFSIDDNFFYIGGHSLLAIQVVNRIKKDIGFDVSVRDLFNNPSIMKLENFIVNLSKVPLASKSADKLILRSRRM